jgi:hypothetical protein
MVEFVLDPEVDDMETSHFQSVPENEQPDRV